MLPVPPTVTKLYSGTWHVTVPSEQSPLIPPTTHLCISPFPPGSQTTFLLFPFQWLAIGHLSLENLSCRLSAGRTQRGNWPSRDACLVQAGSALTAKSAEGFCVPQCFQSLHKLCIPMLCFPGKLSVFSPGLHLISVQHQTELPWVYLLASDPSRVHRV